MIQTERIEAFGKRRNGSRHPGEDGRIPGVFP